MTQRTAGRTADPEAQVRRAFVARFEQVVREIGEEADLQVLTEALSLDSSISALALALTQAVPFRPAHDPLAAARARGAAARERLVSRTGPLLRVGEVAERLGVSAQAVQARRGRGTLLAVPLPNGEHVYPALQFGDRGAVAGLGAVLARFRDADPWTQLSVLAAPSRRHEGRSAFELLHAGEVEAAERIATGYGEHLG